MSVFKEANKWFEEENNKAKASSNSSESLNDINEQLEALAEEERVRLEKEKQDYIDMFKPEDKEFVYKEFEGLTDEEIKKLAEEKYNDYYNDGNSEIESEYNEEISDAENDIIEAEKESKDNSTEVNETLEDDVKDFRDSAYVRGILDSSITSSKNTQLDGIASEDLDKIIAQLESEIKVANELKVEAQKDKDSDKKKLSSDYSSKVDGQVKSSTTDREREKDKVESYNKLTKKEQEAFEKLKLDIADDKGKEYDKQQKADNELEAIYGYSGDRAKHYEKRVATAKAYYDKFDSDEVFDMIKSNPALSRLLGYEYNKFVQSYRNAK